MDTMENKDRQEKENKAFEEMRNAGKNLEEQRQRKESGTQGTTRLWMWFGVLLLIFILLYLLFAIGTFRDLANWFNG